MGHFQNTQVVRLHVCSHGNVMLVTFLLVHMYCYVIPLLKDNEPLFFVNNALRLSGTDYIVAVCTVCLCDCTAFDYSIVPKMIVY